MSNPPDKPVSGRTPIATGPTWVRFDWLACLAIVLIAGAVYLNALKGEWVYDDMRQIVRNTLIQRPSTIGTALASDVWAFKGAPPGQRVSNYWRPTFVGWIAAHYHLFGIKSTTAWHATNVLLHMLTTGLVFIASRRLGLATAVAAAMGLIFAVHPVHVESVAWISGSPDLLLAALLLGSTLLLVSSIERQGTAAWIAWAGALGLFALAQGAKEVALFFPLIAAAFVWAIWRGTGGEFRRVALLKIAPFCIVSLAYIVLRPMLIGAKPPGAYTDLDPGALIWNAPQTAMFYLRQVFMPYEIGPSYPIRAISSATMAVWTLWVPLAVCAAAGVAMLAAARQSRIALLGLAIWVFTLGPAMNIGAFHAEQVVHDRYLYLPLLGVLLILVPLAAVGIGRVVEPERRAGLVLLGLCAIAAVPLAIQTWRYNAAWMSNVALWEWGVKSDPTSGFNAHQLAVSLHGSAKESGTPNRALLERAAAAAERAVLLDPTSLNAWMIRGEVATDQGKYAEAESALIEGLRVAGADSQRYEVVQLFQRLAVAHERQGKRIAAEASLREARRRVPQYRAMVTEMLAVVLYGQGKKAEALTELESVRAEARTEPNPEARLVLFRLAQLYEESRRPADAAKAYKEFLEVVGEPGDASTANAIRISRERLSRLGG